MFSYNRLSKVFKSSLEFAIDDSSKLILFSDCHRGDNSWADDFANNQNIYLHALVHYFDRGYTYIEIGDGDELWKNRDLSEIINAHKDIFQILKKFYNENRFYMIWGNHDVVKKSRRFTAKNLYTLYNKDKATYEPLFNEIIVHEGLKLRLSGMDKRIFVVHGHQADFSNDKLWRVHRFFTRYLWRQTELVFGFKDLTSPAKNYSKRNKIEKKIVNWVKSKNQMLIAGHTHRPTFPDAGQPPYFNSGSCVHPRAITGIEIQNGKITFVEWTIRVREDGVLCVEKNVIAGPQKLQLFFD